MVVFVRAAAAAATVFVAAVLLLMRGAQALQTVALHIALPAQEFLDRQRIAFASVVQRKDAAADRGNDFRLLRGTQRFVSGAGRSDTESHFPFGPMTVGSMRFKFCPIHHLAVTKRKSAGSTTRSVAA